MSEWLGLAGARLAQRLRRKLVAPGGHAGRPPHPESPSGCWGRRGRGRGGGGARGWGLLPHLTLGLRARGVFAIAGAPLHRVFWPLRCLGAIRCCTLLPLCQASQSDRGEGIHSVGSCPNCLDKGLPVHGRGTCADFMLKSAHGYTIECRPSFTPLPRQSRPSGPAV